MPCVAFLSFSDLLALRIPCLEKNRAGLCAFRAFVCFAGVGLYLFSLFLGVKDYQQRVIVAGTLWTFLLIFFFFFFFFFLFCKYRLYLVSVAAFKFYSLNNSGTSNDS